MTSSGELYQRSDGKWAFRITASNGQIVATDGGQGYESKFVEAAFNRRELIRELAETRVSQSMSQTRLAALMGTSQSAVARLESGDSDVRASTLARYAAALGRRIEFQVVDDSAAS